MGRRKKVSTNEACPDNSPGLNINLELNIRALKARNQQLAQALATALQDKAQKITEINALQAESFDLHNKFAMLQNIVACVNVSAKECLPMLNQLVSMFTKVIQLTSPGSTVSHLSYTPDKDRRTQTVTPRTVNGHVLSNPTINLSRMVDRSTNNIQETNAETSTNLEMNSALHVVIDRNDIQNIANNKRNEPVERRNRYATSFNDLICDRELSEDDDTKSEDEEVEQSDIDEEEENPRLVTVPEEDEENCQVSDSNQGCCKEMRVCLQPLCPSQIMNTLNTELDSSQTSLRSDNETNDTLHASQAKQSSIEQSDHSSLQSNHNESGNSSSLSMRTDSDAELCESTVKKICFRRGKPFEESDSLVTFNPSPADLSKLSFINNTSSVGNSSTVTSHGHENMSEKIMTLYDLGLTIKTPNIATSTPIGNNIIRTRLSRKLGNSDSPISTVTMKRGSSEAKKMDCTVRGKIKLEKRLSGSPIKKIGDILNNVSDAKVSDIVKIKRESLRRSSSAATVRDEELDACSSSKAGVREERLEIRRNRKHTYTKGKENELKIVLSKKSPRPKRSARPAELKEPNLQKKLRRSK